MTKKISAEEKEINKLYGLILTERERNHISVLEQSCIFIEMKNLSLGNERELTTLDMILLLKDFGHVKVTREHSHGFWCIFLDALN